MPGRAERSARMAVIISSAIQSAVSRRTRRGRARRGSRPRISISSSPISKVGLPAAGTVQDVSATPIERVRAFTLSAERLKIRKPGLRLGGRPDDLFDHERPGDPAPSRRVEGVLDRHVVVGHDGHHLRPAISTAISKFMTSPS